MIFDLLLLPSELWTQCLSRRRGWGHAALPSRRFCRCGGGGRGVLGRVGNQLLLLEYCPGTVIVIHGVHHWHRDEGAVLGRELVGDGRIVVALLRIVLGCCELGLSHGAQQVIELGKVKGLICFQPLTQLNSLRDKHGETSSNSCDVMKYLVH